MKALIRQPDEIVHDPSEATEEALTHPSYYGGQFAVADNAPEDSVPSDFDITETEMEETIEETYEEINEEGETETKTRAYTKVRKIKIATLNEARYEARKAAEPEFIPEEADGEA